MDYKTMTQDELGEVLYDVICKREDYPQNSGSKKALALDEEYWEITNILGELKQFVAKIREFVMSDTVRKENFSDIEICCEADNEVANDEVEEILEKYSYNDCINYMNERELAY